MQGGHPPVWWEGWQANQHIERGNLEQWWLQTVAMREDVMVHLNGCDRGVPILWCHSLGIAESAKVEREGRQLEQ